MKIHIVIPAFNQYEFLAQAIQSIQSTKPDECDVTVIDNGSNQKGLAHIMAILPRWHVTVNKTNLGVTKPWNQGLDYAMERKADVVCICNSDVIFGPKAIENCALVAKQYGAAFPESIQGGPMRGDFLPKSLAQAANPWDTKVDTRGFAGWCFFLSRETIEKVGRFDEQFTLWYQDTDYHQRLRTAGITPWEVRSCLLHHYESRTILSMPQQFECHGWRRQDEINYKRKYGIA